MFTQQLTQIGLTKEEAEIYEVLLNQGPLNASDIAKNTSVKRTYVYTVIQNLITRGLVSEDKKGRSTLYIPQSPDKLMNLSQSRQLELDQAKNSLDAILPQLKSLYSINESKPNITYYEGIEGIKKIFGDIYSPKEEIVWGCVDLESSDQAIPNHVIETLIPLRIKNKVKAISFIAESDQAKEVQANDSKSLRESFLLSKTKYPLPAEIDVYDDKIAMLSFKKGKFAGVIIQNQDLATSLKSIFKKAFNK